MNRLPKRFEEEVLSKHGIEWGFSYLCYWNNNAGDKADKYKLAGIALEAIMLEYDVYFKGSGFRIEEDYIVISRENWQDWLFKAVMEVYK